MKSSLNVAIVGCGKFGLKRAQAIASIDNAKIYCAVDSCKKALAKDIFSGSLKYDSISGLENINEVDLFIISTPNFTHYALIKKLLESNANILCEKPLCITQDELASIERLAEFSTGSIFMGSNLSYFPSFLKLKSYLVENNLSKFESIKCSIGHNNKSSLNDWNLDRKRSGGGTLIDNGVHLIYFLSQILDDLKVVDVKTTDLSSANSVETEIEVNAKSNSCAEVTLISSWSRKNGYADIILRTIDGDIISVDAFDDFITVNGKEIEVEHTGKSLELELRDICRNLGEVKTSNLALVRETLNFIFSCYLKLY